MYASRLRILPAARFRLLALVCCVSALAGCIGGTVAQSVLRLRLEGLGVTKLPGDAATAPAMWEFFTAP